MASLRKLDELIQRIAVDGVDVDDDGNTIDTELLDVMPESEAMELHEILDALDMSVKEKIEQLGFARKARKAKIDLIDDEIKALREWKARLVKRGEALDEYCMFHMMRMGVKKIVGKLMTVRIQKNPMSATYAKNASGQPVVLGIDPEYVEEVVTYKVDTRKAIQDYKANGEPIEGITFHDDKHHIRTSR